MWRGNDLVTTMQSTSFGSQPFLWQSNSTSFTGTFLSSPCYIPDPGFFGCFSQLHFRHQLGRTDWTFHEFHIYWNASNGSYQCIKITDSNFITHSPFERSPFLNKQSLHPLFEIAPLNFHVVERVHSQVITESHMWFYCQPSSKYQRQKVRAFKFSKTSMQWTTHVYSNLSQFKEKKFGQKWFWKK